MDLSRSLKLAVACICLLSLLSCEKKYSGTINVSSHTWLKGKKIFVDPGHGGTASRDGFRSGPGGLTEEEVNLDVSLQLGALLEAAGAVVRLSRIKDVDVPLAQRIAAAQEFAPDLLVSVHHNGTMRRMDGVNYPCVLIWGSRAVSPAGFDFAELLLGEFHRIMDERGSVLSDFSVFPETGSMMLRETHNLCPGVIGEGGFFSDERHARHLRDPQYLTHEAEAYYKAIAEYFRRGVPSARAQIDCRVDNSGFLLNELSSRTPAITLQLDSGVPAVDIDDASLQISLDNLPITAARARSGKYAVNYGPRLYPGAHRIRFSFANSRGQSSPVYTVPFHVPVKVGEHDALVAEGTRMTSYYYTAHEGLKMLLAALSMTVTAPDADTLLWRIAQGFALVGEPAASRYYYSKIFNFYPQSRYRGTLQGGAYDHRYQVEYLGRELSFTEECGSCPSTRTVREIPVAEPSAADGKDDSGFAPLETAKALCRSLREWIVSRWK
jgi:N-acetylmuramoyl-L-alanine amidase